EAATGRRPLHDAANERTLGEPQDEGSGEHPHGEAGPDFGITPGSMAAASLRNEPEKVEARGTSGSPPTEAGCHLRPLGPSAPSTLSRLSRFPYDRPFRWALGRPEPPHPHS